MSQTFYEDWVSDFREFKSAARLVVDNALENDAWPTELTLDLVGACCLRMSMACAIAGLLHEFYLGVRDVEGRAISRAEFLEDGLLDGFVEVLGSAYATYGAPGDAAPNLEQAVFSYALTAFHTGSYEVDGKHDFEVSPGLGLQLLDTELRGLKTEDLRLPYPSVYLVVPPEVELFCRVREDRERIKGIMIVEDQRAFRSWEEREAGEYHRAWNVLLAAHTNGRNFNFGVPLREGATLDEALQELMQTTSAHAFSNIEGYSAPNMQRERDLWLKPFRWAMNAMVYATWPDADREHVIMNPQARKLWEQLQKTPPSKRRDRLQASYNSLDPQERELLGKSVIYIDRSKAEADEAADAAKTGRKLQVLSRVRGHWTHQPCGPRNSLRKLTWLKPYWRGPEGAPVKEAVHRLVGGERS